MSRNCSIPSTIGAALLALFALRQDIEGLLPEGVQVHPLAWKITLLVGIALCAVGTVFLMILLLKALISIHKIPAYLETLREYLARIDKRLDRFSHFEHIPAAENDLPAVLEFSRKSLGEAIDQDVEKMMYSWHRKNPNMLWVLYKVTSRKVVRNGIEKVRSSKKMTGYFSIFPLKKKSARKVEQGELYGSRITSDDMVTVNGRPSAVYIGGVVATTRPAQAYALKVLMSRLDSFLRRRIPVYTRPVSKDGLRLAHKYGFRPVRPTAESSRFDVVHKMLPKHLASAIGAKAARNRKRAA